MHLAKDISTTISYSPLHTSNTHNPSCLRPNLLPYPSPTTQSPLPPPPPPFQANDSVTKRPSASAAAEPPPGTGTRNRGASVRTTPRSVGGRGGPPRPVRGCVAGAAEQRLGAPVPSPVAAGQDARRGAGAGEPARGLEMRRRCSWRGGDRALVQWARRAPGGCGGCGRRAGRRRAGGPRGGLRQAGRAWGRRATRLAGKGLAAVGAAGMGRGWQQRGLAGAAAGEGEGTGLTEEEGGLAAGRGLRQAMGGTGGGGGWGGVAGRCGIVGGEGPGEGERWGTAGGDGVEWRWGAARTGTRDPRGGRWGTCCEAWRSGAKMRLWGVRAAQGRADRRWGLGGADGDRGGDEGARRRE